MSGNPFLLQWPCDSIWSVKSMPETLRSTQDLGAWGIASKTTCNEVYIAAVALLRERCTQNVKMPTCPCHSVALKHTFAKPAVALLASTAEHPSHPKDKKEAMTGKFPWHGRYPRRSLSRLSTFQDAIYGGRPNSWDGTYDSGDPSN